MSDEVGMQEVGEMLENPQEPEILADAAISLLESRGIDPRTTAMAVSNDMNGVWTDTDEAHLPISSERKSRVQNMSLREGDYAFLNSGHPVPNLKFFRDERLERPDLGIVGELGSVYLNGSIEQVFSGRKQELVNVYRDIYREAAAESVKILPQNNVSEVVGSVRVEGEGEDRSGLHNVPGRGYGTEELWTELSGYEGFEFEGDAISFPDTFHHAEVLTDVLREGPIDYPGLRFETGEGDRIEFYRDPEDDPDYTLEDAHEFVNEAIPDDWEHYAHDDWGVDFVNPEVEVNKGVGARALADEVIDNDYVILHVGDKESDIMYGEDAVNFPVEGSEAHVYCEENGIPYVPVEDGGEFAETVSLMADKIGHAGNTYSQRGG